MVLSGSDSTRQLMETVACNFCGNRDDRELLVLPDLLLDRPAATSRLVECTRCGLVYQNPRPTLEEMGEHYPPVYDSYHTPTPGQGSWLTRKGVEYGVRKRTRAITRYLSEGRLLDIGCATGEFLHSMQQLPGWEVEGVEVTGYAAGIARERFNLAVFHGTVEEAAFPDQSFHAVTMWDVLEHLHNPTGTLAEIYRILKPGGLLVFRVPNRLSIDARLFGRYWAGLDAPRHLYVFEAPILTDWLASNGFTVIRKTSRVGGYPTFILSVRFWLVGRSVQAGAKNAVMGILNSPFCRVLSIPPFFLTSLALRGPLLVVTAVKQEGGVS